MARLEESRGHPSPPRAPLLFFDLSTRPLDDPQRWLHEWARLARGGWLAFAPGWRRFWSEAALSQATAAENVRLILAGDPPERGASGDGAALDREATNADEDADLAAYAWREELATLNEAFVVATDPSLAPVRQGLALLARAGKGAVLFGRHGRGRKTLAAWMLGLVRGDRPQRIAAGQGAPLELDVTQDWLLEDAEVFGEEELSAVSALVGKRADFARLRERLLDPTLSRRPSPPLVAAGETTALAKSVGTQSGRLLAALATIARAMREKDHVLLQGERGVGKTWIAERAHEVTHEGQKAPFIVADLASIELSLIETELFGIVGGTATGVRSREGLFKAAEGGTLFLDELGALPIEKQRVLLRVLQSGRYRKVGSTSEEKANVTVLLATNTNLDEATRSGRFRADLRDRIGVTVVIPPLRERPEDLIPLARRCYLREDKPAPHLPWIDAEAERLLYAWSWPGNVRELNARLSAARHESSPGRAPLPASALGELYQAAQGQMSRSIWSTADRHTPRSFQALTPRIQQGLRGAAVELPALGERPGSARHAIFAALRGRPISEDGVAALERLSWPGDLQELKDTIETLLASDEPILTAQAIRRVHPTLLRDGLGGSIYVLLQPTLAGLGRLKGSENTSSSPCLVLGRGGSFSALREHADQAPDPALGATLSAVEALCAGDTPEILTLSDEVSRVTGLVRREGVRLLISTFSGAQHELWVLSLDSDDRQFRLLSPGETFTAHHAALVELRQEGQRKMTLAVATSELALMSYDETVRDMLPQRLDDTLTRDEKREPAPPVAPLSMGGKALELTEPQHEALTTAILTVTSATMMKDEFPPTLVKHLKAQALKHPELSAVLLYIERGNYHSQNLHRLYNAQANKAAWRSLVEALLATTDAARRVELLPKPLQDKWNTERAHSVHTTSGG